MGINSFALILGKGSAVISVNRKRILIRDCLYVPAVRNQLYSLRVQQCHSMVAVLLVCTSWVFFVFFPLFLVEIDTAADCHLLYEPIGRSCTVSSLGFVQPILSISLASTTTALPSAPEVIEDNATDNILPTYAEHWPKQPKPQ